MRTSTTAATRQAALGMSTGRSRQECPCRRWYQATAMATGMTASAIAWKSGHRRPSNDATTLTAASTTCRRALSSGLGSASFAVVLVDTSGRAGTEATVPMVSGRPASAPLSSSWFCFWIRQAASFFRNPESVAARISMVVASASARSVSPDRSFSAASSTMPDTGWPELTAILPLIRRARLSQRRLPRASSALSAMALSNAASAPTWLMGPGSLPSFIPCLVSASSRRHNRVQLCALTV